MLFKQKMSEFLNLLMERSEIPDSIDKQKARCYYYNTVPIYITK